MEQSQHSLPPVSRKMKPARTEGGSSHLNVSMRKAEMEASERGSASAIRRESFERHAVGGGGVMLR